MRFSCAVRTRSSTISRVTAGRVRQVGRLQHVDQLVHLLDHLRRGCLASTSTTMVMRDSVGIERARDRQAFDVVAALAEQAGDAHQRAGLVFQQVTK